ncbi:PIN domain nuclease [Symbioplanes lichenis]|uniref:PIN domain nuclease n=1 Tax=Symbioplanes lichenis TaxID=1629072 RepID=UPI0027399375|nr:PIN domain nuclease [Actinoplanes lichenis]
MTSTRYLIDNSSFTRLAHNPGLREKWRKAMEDGIVGVCALAEVEILYSARDKAEFTEMLRDLSESFVWVMTPDRAEHRLREVQRALVDRGAHKSAGPVDLLIAAVAELQGLTVLHYDRDFATVARVTGQPVQWVAEPGSVD